mmetsp:Transcript_18006/g.37732  ORF Transcript_18006/g.37732 Transcript_18006/m.37732 type:complete len:190 (-) Transcript_18006:54-623(-)
MCHGVGCRDGHPFVGGIAGRFSIARVAGRDGPRREHPGAGQRELRTDHRGHDKTTPTPTASPTSATSEDEDRVSNPGLELPLGLAASRQLRCDGEQRTGKNRGAAPATATTAAAVAARTSQAAAARNTRIIVLKRKSETSWKDGGEDSSSKVVARNDDNFGGNDDNDGDGFYNDDNDSVCFRSHRYWRR